MARTRRRDLKKELFWREMVRGQPASGLSVRAWCRRHDVREPAFYWWRRRLAGRSGENAAAAFVPVRVADDAIAAGIAAADVSGAGAARIEIVLAAGYRVQLIGPVDRQALADVLAVLTKDDLAGEAGGNGRAAEASVGSNPARAGARWGHEKAGDRSSHEKAGGNGRITEAGARPVRGEAHSC